MDADDRVDVLAISAFPGDYTPTDTSVIGGLAREGVSVAALARRKAADLRPSFGCWLSEPVEGQDGFARILCFEPLTRGVPTDVMDDFFRGVAALSGASFAVRSIAMSIFASGDQHYPPEEVLQILLRAAQRWMSAAFPLRTLRIVSNQRDFGGLREVFRRFDAALATRRPARTVDVDIFLAAAEDDEPLADVVCHVMSVVSPGISTFRAFAADTVASVVAKDARRDALDASRRVMALITPNFLRSRSCLDALAWAMFREGVSSAPLLFPIYMRQADLKGTLEVLRMVDCRDMNLNSLRAVAALLAIEAQGFRDLTDGAAPGGTRALMATRSAAQMLGIPVLGTSRRQSDPGAPGSVSQESMLLHLCISMFKPEEFRVFLRHLPGGPGLMASLADCNGMAPLVYFDRAIEALARFKLLDRDFFDRLRAERPGRVDEITCVEVVGSAAA